MQVDQRRCVRRPTGTHGSVAAAASREARRIPFDTDTSTLLEVKDIAALYELWCFFEVQHAVTQILGAPSLAQAPVTTALQTYLPFDLRILQPQLLPHEHAAPLLLAPAAPRHRPVHAPRHRDPLRRQVPPAPNRDLYKMHTYRDALQAPAVWILYPGHDFRFFRAHQAAPAITDPTTLHPPLEGVGAIPLDPTEASSPRALAPVLETLLGAARQD